MQYALIYSYNPDETGPGGGPEIQEWLALDQQAKEAGVHVYAVGFHSSERARTVTVRDVEGSVSDGPATRPDVVAGVWVLDVPDAETAIQWAQRVPTATYGKVEVRPVVEWES